MAPRSAHRVLAIAAAGLLAGAVLHGVVPHEGIHEAFAQAASFLEPFTGAPPAPIPFASSSWDVTISSLAPSTWKQLEPMEAGHGTNCSAPPATHHLNGDYADAVFLCNNHLMTAINAGQYAALYLTPARMVDFSSGEAVIRFDLSTLRTSARDWVDVWISPYDEHLQIPLEEGFPDFQGEPKRAILVRMDMGQAGSCFRVKVIRDHSTSFEEANCGLGMNSFLTPSAERRDTIEVRLSKNRIRVAMPAYNAVWTDASIPDLGWTRGVVQFGHHSYNPTKECTPSGTLTCQPNTWHWDNVSIDPAVPFTMLRANRRYVDAGTTPDVTFPSPTPTGSHLRFAGIGNALEVSFNQGASWSPAVRQVQEKYVPEHRSSYWTPIPAGVTSVRFRGQSSGPVAWMASDISVWSQGGVQPPTATNTPIPTGTLAPTTTPTVAPATCEVRVRIGGTEQWLAKPAAFCR